MKDQVNKSEPPYFSLSGVTHERQRPLTSESILGIGNVVGADKLELVVRIPGDEDQKLLLINWEKNAPNKEPQPVPFSSLKDSVIEKVLRTGSEIIRKGEHEYVDGERKRRLE